MSKHSIQRTYERYNIELNKNDEKYILGMINSGQAFLLPITNLERKKTRFAYVKFKKIPIKVLYSYSNSNHAVSIVTVYPLDVDEYNHLLEEKTQQDIENCIKFLKINGYIVYKKKSK